MDRVNVDSPNAAEEVEVIYGNKPVTDFNESGTNTMNTDIDQQQFEAYDPAAVERKRKIKSDVFSLIASGVINGIPIAIDALKHRKDVVPHKVEKRDLVKFGVSMIMPAVQVIDTVVLKNKIQNSIEEKTPFKFGDIRNVANIIQAYPATHSAIKNFMSNVQKQSTGQIQVETNPNVKRDAVLGCLNTISPYVIDKFCDPSATFVEKCSSVIPLKIFGGLVRKFASTSPKLQQVYDVGTSLVRVADYGNKTLGSAVRANSNMRTGAVNTLGTLLDVVQDATGMTRGNVSRFNDDRFDSWGGARSMSF